MKDVTYELLLPNPQEVVAGTNLSTLRKVIQEIESTFETQVSPLFEDELIPEGNTELQNYYQITIPVADDKVWETAHQLQNIEDVINVDPDLPTRISIEPDIESSSSSSGGEEPEPDNKQWNKHITNFEQALRYSREHGNRDGERLLRIGQIDTGYTDHPEIRRIRKSEGFNFMNGSGNARDPLTSGMGKQPGHGTSVASVILGENTSIPGDRTNGVLPNVLVVPYRIHDSVVLFRNDNLPRAALRALRRGCRVVTSSMGGVPKSSWHAAARALYNAGSIWTSAAGNQVRVTVWPANYAEVVCCAAIGPSGNPWSGSSRGSAVEISAPGHQVWVARTTQNSSGGESYSYGSGSGTSYATPHIAAVAALWVAHHGTALRRYTHPWQLVEAFRHCLRRSANNRGGSWDTRNFGAGVLDALALLRCPLPAPAALTHADYVPPGEFTTFNRPVTVAEKEVLYYAFNNDSGHLTGLKDFIMQKASPSTKRHLESVLGSIDKIESFIQQDTDPYDDMQVFDDYVISLAQ